MKANGGFQYVFPAIRGIQAKREFYVSMVPLRLLPKVFSFNEEGEVPPQLRVQRGLNKSRIPAMAKYVLENPSSYIFSAITASIDADVKFEPFSDSFQSNSTAGLKTGLLHVPMSARFIINDGQHRRAAIAGALEENPALGDESIAVVFFLDTGLERCQQMFADLNGHAVKTSRAINILFDHRERTGKIAKALAFECPVFKNYVEMDRSTLAARSRKLFTLSAIYSATKELMSDFKDESLDKAIEIASSFWKAAADNLQEWKMVINGSITAGEVRRDFIFANAIGLHALGKTGRFLLEEKKNWQSALKELKTIDWARTNYKLWEGRAMISGKLSKSDINVTLTSNVIKKALGLELTPDEQKVENSFRRG
ncbi:MAG: DNA sulfur modification protein DndB [Chlamydiae bacterium]|nr:DNA sulfur modification protein DndB [Chlamydiota bacterium]